MASTRRMQAPPRCPFLAPVVADWLWLHPAGVYCRRPDGRVRVPAEVTLARVCGTEAHRACPGYREGVPARRREPRRRPRPEEAMP
jgi:hypothetical protein